MTDLPDDETTARSARAAAAARARRIGGRRAPVTDDVAKATAEPAKTRPAASVTTETDVAAEPEATLEAAAPARPRPGPKPAPSAKKPAPAASPKPPAKEAARGTGFNPEWLPAAVMAALALVFAVLIAVFAISGGSSNSTHARNQIREQVLAAAKTCTARENTYNYTTIAADEKAALACTTGDFYTQVKETFDKVLIPQAPGQHQVQATTIDLAAVERISANGKEWTILVFGQNSVTNTSTGTSTPRIDPFAAEVTMKKVGSKWLMSDLGYA